MVTAPTPWHSPADCVKRCRLQVCVSPHREPSDVSHIFGWILPVNYWPLLGIAVIVISLLNALQSSTGGSVRGGSGLLADTAITITVDHKLNAGALD